jgi:hypothetical protein
MIGRRTLVALIALAAAAALPARADVIRYDVHEFRSADGRLGSGSKYADVWVFRFDSHGGSLTDPENSHGSALLGCVEFVSGSVRKQSCGTFAMTFDDTTLSKATVTGSVPQPGGGTITVNMVVTATVGAPFVGLPVNPASPAVPRYCLPRVQPPPCWLIGTGAGRPGATSGSVRSSTLGTVTAAGGGSLSRGAYLLLEDD